ncbi:MAG: hypothetical protein WBG86_05175, partial [Polyangiales bacterium]
MFKPKHVIPTLAAAVLSLNGCGDDSGTGGTAGTGGTGATGGTGSNALEAAEAFCRNLTDCYMETEYAYTNCVEYYYGYTVAAGDEFGQACASAFITYFDCVAGLTCEVLGGDEVTA